MLIDWKLVNYISLPIIGALIGWFTNYIAVKMLFRPQRAVKFLGISIQGLVPRRQKDLANKIAQTVEQNLISHRDVEAVLQSAETQAEIESLLEKQIESFMKEKLASIPMLGMFLQGDMLNNVKGKLVQHLKASIPEFVDGLVGKVSSRLNFQDIVREKVESFELLQLEAIIYGICSKELKTIEILGGVLGFLIGLGQIGLQMLSQP